MVNQRYNRLQPQTILLLKSGRDLLRFVESRREKINRDIWPRLREKKIRKKDWQNVERVDRDRRYTRHWLLYTKARAAIFQDKKIGRFEIDRRKYKDRNVDTGDWSGIRTRWTRGGGQTSFATTGRFRDYRGKTEVCETETKYKN